MLGGAKSTACRCLGPSSDASQHPRGANRVRAMRSFCVLENEGAGNAGCLAAPAASCAVKKAHEFVTTGQPKRSGIPCAMVLRLIRDLLGVPGLIASVAREASLTNLIPASGDQDHAILPSALSRSSNGYPRPPRSTPTFVTVAKRPSIRSGTKREHNAIMSLRQDLTGARIQLVSRRC